MFTKISKPLYEKIAHYARFPQTGVSLSQMVKFGKSGLSEEESSDPTRKTQLFALLSNLAPGQNHLWGRFSRPLNLSLRSYLSALPIVSLS
ncbi:[Pyruvate dehydrogenase (acetyl-transferring)] kinase isozyme 2 [Entomophthora muscae]|uniref:[Pyruvate dehydrogenase (Acetyl-transferring)] kinase isozyme 2 n=1 Tax=Entomophthora muscae TaxID=34485 RepID=A0ACC2UK39_9FUNG|nr:[Pyruvate dehydrogenase (acetyl-transferring)] kinase isozyme 2 [Entomophthora muscae]